MKASVVIPCYHDRDFIGPCLDSVLAVKVPPSIATEVGVIDGTGPPSICTRTRRRPSPPHRGCSEGAAAAPQQAWRTGECRLLHGVPAGPAQEMRERGRAAVRERYSWHREHLKLLALCAGLGVNPPAPAGPAPEAA